MLLRQMVLSRLENFSELHFMQDRKIFDQSALYVFYSKNAIALIAVSEFTELVESSESLTELSLIVCCNNMADSSVPSSDATRLPWRKIKTIPTVRNLPVATVVCTSSVDLEIGTVVYQCLITSGDHILHVEYFPSFGDANIKPPNLSPNQIANKIHVEHKSIKHLWADLEDNYFLYAYTIDGLTVSIIFANYVSFLHSFSMITTYLLNTSNKTTIIIRLR